MYMLKIKSTEKNNKNDRHEIVKAAPTVSIRSINEEKITNYKFSDVTFS